ncbi:MAG: oxygen-independent coproporphyrinogen III oxidase [Planctomycetota bacterium]
MSDAPLTAAVTAELLAKYDRPGPRYTSYPTAVEFHDGFTGNDYEAKLAEAAQATDEALSLYVHLPFCHERCTFCGCNVIITRKHEPSDRYLRLLHKEVRMVAERLGDRRGVVQYHWGGGTPTYQTIPEMAALQKVVAKEFDLLPGAEIAIEVDPRVTTDEQLEALRDMGFNRLSMGVQDFRPEVQEAINRNQTLEETERLFVKAKDLGYESINVDLVYGLPLQEVETFRETLRHVIRLRPDRVACYSFAHIPWIRGNQRRIRPEDLPAAELKLALFGTAMEEFFGDGYEQIGMDHFALPDDEMAVAARERTLHRNFMGYTVKPATDMIGLGVSSIGDLRGVYAQNTKKLSAYQRAIEGGTLPIEKGVVLTGDDRIRRDVITRLMCNFHLDMRVIEKRWNIDFAEYFKVELEALEQPVGHGFVELSDDTIEVVGHGKLFIRNVCMIFDAYLAAKTGTRPMFSRTV